MICLSHLPVALERNKHYTVLMISEDDMSWLDAGEGYEVALHNHKLICRNAQGDVLAAVPRKIMRGDVARRLLLVGGMVVDHEKAAFDTVQRWMLRSLPTRAQVLHEVWGDPAWRSLLEHLVIIAVGPGGEANLRQLGFLMDVTHDGWLRLMRVTGREVMVKPARVLVPHPVILEHLIGLRRLMMESWIEQNIEQLSRPVWRKPAHLDLFQQSLDSFRGRLPEASGALAQRARTLGYRVQGSYVVYPLQEMGRQIQARLWIGDQDGEGATHLGELQWVDGQGRALSLGTVGPIAFSEGHYMAHVLSQEEP